MTRTTPIATASLLLTNLEQSRSSVAVHIEDIDTQERTGQKLILLAHHGHPGADVRAVIHDVFNSALTIFNESTALTPELVIEEVLDRMNELIPTLTIKRSRPLLDDLTLVIAISDRGQVHFSQFGSAIAHLIHDGLSETIAEPTQPENPLKPFGHVTSGVLNPGHAIIFTTISVTDYVSERKIAKILTEYPPSVAVAEMSTTLNLAPSSASFAAALIKFTTERDDRTAAQWNATPQTIPTIADAQSLRPLRPVRTLPNRSSGMALPVLKWILRQTGSYIVLLWTIVVRSIKMITLGASLIASSSSRRSFETDSLSIIDEKIHSEWRHIRQLPKIQQLYLVALIASLIVFCHLLLVQGVSKQVKRQSSSYQDALTVVIDRWKGADAALIYKDTQRAEQLLMEASALLSSVRASDATQQSELVRFREENDEKLTRLRRLTTVPMPVILHDLSSLPSLSHTLSYDGTKLFVGLGDSIYALNGSAPTIVASNATLTQLIAERMIGINSSGRFMRMQGTSFEPMELSLQNIPIYADALGTYGDNLYILDRGASTIYKFVNKGSSLGSGSIWLQNPILSKARSITLDGSLYALFDDGTIKKYFKGGEQAFTHGTLNAVPSPTSRLITTLNADALVIMDPGNRRVIVLGKDGAIRDQFISPRFDDLRDIALNEKEGIIAVLNGATIVSLPLKK